MRLTKVDIYGFKSFARRTDFEFGAGTTLYGVRQTGKLDKLKTLGKSKVLLQQSVAVE